MQPMLVILFLIRYAGQKPREQFLGEHNISPETKVIGLLPGSRKREVSSLLPAFLEAAEKLERAVNDKLVFVIPKASTIDITIFKEAGVGRNKNIDVRIIEGDRYNLMAACDCVVAASGTVTLELALLKTPMVVAYKLSPLTYSLGKHLVKLDCFSLVNLIAGFKVVPELLQDEVEGQTICDDLAMLLNVYQKNKTMRNGLDLVNKRLGTKGASSRAAEVVVEMLNTQNFAYAK